MACRTKRALHGNKGRPIRTDTLKLILGSGELEKGQQGAPALGSRFFKQPLERVLSHHGARTTVENPNSEKSADFRRFIFRGFGLRDSAFMQLL
jgi:hypothetical protein